MSLSVMTGEEEEQLLCGGRLEGECEAAAKVDVKNQCD